MSWEKIGAQLEDIDGKVWKIHPSKRMEQLKTISIDTYDDHRMAMAFAPLATLMDIEIKNPFVADKSYPGFWKHLQEAGFELRFV